MRPKQMLIKLRLISEGHKDEGHLTPNRLRRKDTMRFDVVTNAVIKMRALTRMKRGLNREVAERPNLDGAEQESMPQRHDLV